MSLSEKIRQEMIQAVKSKDAARLSTLRMIRSAVQNREIDKRAPLNDEEVVEILSSLTKRYKESIEQFKMGNRQDLVDKEKAELQVVLSFLPEQMSEEEIRGQLLGVIQEVGAHGPKDLGIVMKTVMQHLRGRADGRLVQQLARELLSSHEG